MFPRPIVSTLTVLLAVGVLGGCSRDDVKEAKGRTLDFTMTEYRLSPLTTYVDGAGKVTIKIRNDGDQAHNVALSKKGNIVLGRTTTIQKGQSAEMQLDLTEGTYRVFSSLSNDDTLGLNGYLVVR